MDLLLMLWPICGWVVGYMTTPKWMFDRDPAGYVILFFCGGIAGPIGATIWILTAPEAPK